MPLAPREISFPFHYESPSTFRAKSEGYSPVLSNQDVTTLQQNLVGKCFTGTVALKKQTPWHTDDTHLNDGLKAQCVAFSGISGDLLVGKCYLTMSPFYLQREQTQYSFSQDGRGMTCPTQSHTVTFLPLPDQQKQIAQNLNVVQWLMFSFVCFINKGITCLGSLVFLSNLFHCL